MTNPKVNPMRTYQWLSADCSASIVSHGNAYLWRVGTTTGTTTDLGAAKHTVDMLRAEVVAK